MLSYSGLWWVPWPSWLLRATVLFSKGSEKNDLVIYYFFRPPKRIQGLLIDFKLSLISMSVTSVTLLTEQIASSSFTSGCTAVMQKEITKIDVDVEIKGIILVEGSVGVNVPPPKGPAPKPGVVGGSIELEITATVDEATLKDPEFVGVFLTSFAAKLGVAKDSLSLKLSMVGGKLVVHFELTMLAAPMFVVTSMTKNIEASGFGGGLVSSLKMEFASTSYQLSITGVSVSKCGVLEKPETVPEPPSVTGTLEVEF